MPSQLRDLPRGQDRRIPLYRVQRHRFNQRLSLTRLSQSQRRPPMKQKEWTIMIYMAGDNNLAVDMAYALEQIKGVAEAGADSPNLMVYYDGSSPSIPTLYCDF